jgi:hypothetical protein
MWTLFPVPCVEWVSLFPLPSWKMVGPRTRGPGIPGSAQVPEAGSWHLTVRGPKTASSWVSGCWEGAGWRACAPARLRRRGTRGAGIPGAEGTQLASFPFNGRVTHHPSVDIHLSTSPRCGHRRVPTCRTTVGGRNPRHPIPPTCPSFGHIWNWILVSAPGVGSPRDGLRGGSTPVPAELSQYNLINCVSAQ